jgi:glycopeptide antibiotics resistance protein
MKQSVINTLNKFMRLPEKIPCDKRMHFIVGTVLMSLLLIIGSNTIVATVITVIVAFGIEIYQKITKSGKYEIFDAIAVIIGSLFALMPFIAKM